MPRSASRIAVTALALLAATFSAAGWHQTSRLVELREQEILTMQELVTTWTDAQGRTQEVRTPRNANEAKEAWKARHAEGVEVLEELYPPADQT